MGTKRYLGGRAALTGAAPLGCSQAVEARVGGNRALELRVIGRAWQKQMVLYNDMSYAKEPVVEAKTLRLRAKIFESYFVCHPEFRSRC